jgi:hypothetical protein
MATPLPSSSSSTPAQKRARLSGNAAAATDDVPLLRRASTLASTASSSDADPTSSSTTASTVVEASFDDRENASSEMTLTGRAERMADRASRSVPLTDDEVNGVIESVQNLSRATEDDDNAVSPVDAGRLRKLLVSAAHLSHKDWSVTEANADELFKILFPSPSMNSEYADSLSSSFDVIAPVLLERIMADGNWKAAVSHASSKATSSAAGNGAPSELNPGEKPWAVLVTGVNGIRKTTSMYQPWFPQVLEEALVVPSGSHDDESDPPFERDLPTGQNSFFRQLDHMIATLCNHEFEMLYRMTEKEYQRLCMKDVDGGATVVHPEVIEKYTNLKAALFSRYRTLSELLGALLLKQARKRCMNCLMETSGKDIAMFQYVDHFLPEHNKLALRFQINELGLAKASVDERMKSEILAGMQAHTVQQIIQSNQGGPYGSQVLPDIQRDSDAVWHDQVATNRGVGNDWYKATIQIVAHPDRPWTAQAVRPDGTLGTLHEFLPKE